LQTRDPTHSRRRIVPLILQECKLPDRLSVFTYADFWQPIYWGRELERIVDAIEDRVHLAELD
jgi:hypothetical protein